MTDKKQKIKDFTVYAQVNINCTKQVSAYTLEEAMIKAKEFNEHDFVEILGDYNDGDFEILGVISE